jgi:pimeloyl-ACP methyl ester carboxylesterase
MISMPSALRRFTLGAGLAALTGCGAATAPDPATRGLTPPLGRLLQVDGRQVHAVTEGRGPDVILLHGASGNLRDMTFALMPDLVEAGFRVTAFDRPGLGYSDGLHGSGESPAEQARHLSRAAEQLDIRRAVVLGQSYGGAVAMAWALERPDQAAAVVTVSGATMPWPGGLGPWYGIAGSALGGATVVPLVASLASENIVRNAVAGIFEPDPVPEGYLDYVGPDLTLRADTLRANARQVGGLKPHIIAQSQRYADLRLPVEILHGTADTIVPHEIHAIPLSQNVPGANLVLLDGAGHMPHHSHRAETVAAVRRAASRAALR